MTGVNDGRARAWDVMPKKLNAVQIAEARAERFSDPIEQRDFLDAFSAARVSVARGDGRLYVWFREALDAGESVTVAGYIEGATSVHYNGKRVL